MIDLIVNLKCDVEMFGNDTSLFKVVDDVGRYAFQLNAGIFIPQNPQDLDKFNYGRGDGRCNLMQAKLRKLSFLVKRVNHPQALLGNDVIKRKSQYKHLGMKLDSELNF